MWLLNVHNRQLESFFSEEDTPAYAILSHTWQDSEISFQDLRDRKHLEDHPAFQKLDRSCRQARGDGYDYIWIDTCCIDKSSSAELSEAINSMFRWYQQSSVCYIYLSDYVAHGRQVSEAAVCLDVEDAEFCKARWFSRGWTLQELIAPRKAVFFDASWISFGERNGDLMRHICQRTGIWEEVFLVKRCRCNVPISRVRDEKCLLCLSPDILPQILDGFAVAVKMSWAAHRRTTRREDEAYSLLGLFNVNMPLLYGEGRKAFVRLQEAIVRQCNDPTILLWCSDGPDESGCLATSPSGFAQNVPIVGRRIFQSTETGSFFKYSPDISSASIDISGTTIVSRMRLMECLVGSSLLYQTPFDRRNIFWLALIDYPMNVEYNVRCGILLRELIDGSLYARVRGNAIIQATYNDKAWRIVNEAQIGFPVEPLYTSERKDIRILIQAEPSTSVALASGSTTQMHPIILRPDTSDPPRTYTVWFGYPKIYYKETMKELPEPWSPIKYEHSYGNADLCGIHLFSVSFETETRFFNPRIMLLWGHFTLVDDGVEIQATTWCRIYGGRKYLEAYQAIQPPGGEALALDSANVRLKHRHDLRWSDYRQKLAKKLDEEHDIFPTEFSSYQTTDWSKGTLSFGDTGFRMLAEVVRVSSEGGETMSCEVRVDISNRTSKENTT
ncbi:heterokaryon incompatibility protein-domain-containing protein [Stachybotrys elegans]|uniref:Heterokaryon incompatibility protein-domain-containing protein n=1 Tax=Stachybotrys elegans TaxID=80388 RepID=A0A8K0SZR1_9HYPO|nr:heterokaryon incompatibility protein-domain-containing protein [Stachybotrys elegans]